MEEVSDAKDLKKVLKTRKNVLILYGESNKAANKLLELCRDVAVEIKGSGSILFINCGTT